MRKYTAIFIWTLVIPSFDLIAQDVPSDIARHRLPYTWEAPMMGMGKMICTMHEDGSITSRMITGCFNCGGSGMCRVCGGTGGQYWYQIGILPCGGCGGSGRCGACSGKGYSVVSTSTSQSGMTIGYDEHGNCYVSGGEGGGRTRSSSNGDVIYHCCDQVVTFGQVRYHRCANCGDEHRVGTHCCVKH